jgi:membrane-associated phospholipid phosphatase
MDPLIFHTKAIVNTFVRILPLGFYFGTIIMGILFTDLRAFILLMGFVANDAISFGFRQLFQTIDLPTCAIVESNKNFFTMPSSHTQTVSFLMSFFLTEMYSKNTFNPVNFVLLGFILLLTSWSRINIGCESIIDVIFAIGIGVLIGATYYKITETWVTGSTNSNTTNQNLVQQSVPLVEIYQRT